MNERLTGLLGMARRAGHLTAGFDAVKAAVADGKARLVLLAADISPKTEKELRFVASAAAPPLFPSGLTKDEIGHAIGANKPVGVIATDDRGFAAAMQTALGNTNEEDGI